MKTKIQHFLKKYFSKPIPAGPLSAKLNNLNKDADEFFWLRADPVRLEPDHQHVFMRGHIDAPLEQKDLVSILSQLNDLLGEHHLELICLNTKEWLLKVPSSMAIPNLSNLSPEACLNQDISPLLPRGQTEAYWRRLFTECQMIMHPYTNNSLWFWGAGVS